MTTILMVRDDIASQVGGDVIRGKNPDASGNPIFKSGATLDAGYTDITNLANWNRYGVQAAGLDYKDRRNILISDFVGNWSALTDADKKTLVDYYVYPSTETEANLDLLYSKSKRDQCRHDCMKALGECGCVPQAASNNADAWFDIQVLDGGTMNPSPITTDAVI